MTTKTEMRKTKVAGVWAEDVTYEAFVIPGENWNGWACPYFTRSEAEIVVNDQNLKHRQDPEGFPDWLEWDGDVIAIHNEDSTPTTYERIEPTPDGLYSIGAFGWCWQEVAPDNGITLLRWTDGISSYSLALPTKDAPRFKADMDAFYGDDVLWETENDADDFVASYKGLDENGMLIR